MFVEVRPCKIVSLLFYSSYIYIYEENKGAYFGFDGDTLCLGSESREPMDPR